MIPTVKRIVLFLVFLVSVLPLSAQQSRFEITRFEQDPFDVTAQSKATEKIDGSGDRFAIIKVTSTDPNDQLTDYHFNFGFMKSLVETHDGQLWVYVQKNAKHVTVSRDGYKTLYKQDLKTTLQSGMTYVMTLSPVSPSTSGVMYQQMVLFDLEPQDAGAVVMVTPDGGAEDLFGIQDATGAVAKSLPFGTYSYKIRAEMYKMSEGRFTLNDRMQTHLEQVRLQPNFSVVTIDVDAHADIYVNGMKKGVKSWTGHLKAGDYQIECRQDHHHSSFLTIQVPVNDTLRYTVPAPQALVGTLSVTSSPLGAEILIDGVKRGVTPMNVVNVLVGKHELILKKDKYRSSKHFFEITEHNVSSVHLELQKNKKEKVEQPELNLDEIARQLDDSELWVDLGLSVKWASHNVGASVPEEYGDYFAWGETRAKKENTAENGLLYSGALGNISGKSRHDAATANWGAPARMPTEKEVQELKENCEFRWITLHGVKGYLLTSKKNGHHLFLPAAGCRYGTALYDAGQLGYYWSATPDRDKTGLAHFLGVDPERVGIDWSYRGHGFSVRPVRK